MVKELETAHQAYLAERNPTKKDAQLNQLAETMRKLGAIVECDCRDSRCGYWVISRCNCHNTLMCNKVGFLFSDSAEVSDEDMETFKSVLTPEDLKRRPDEPFIVYKVRIMAKIANRAVFVRNYRDEGLTSYRYSSWADDSNEKRETHFRTMVKDLRANDPRNLSKAVGCSICQTVFYTQENLEAHVDRMRLCNEELHVQMAKMIEPDSVTPVRPTSATYQGPTQPPEPTYGTYDTESDRSWTTHRAVRRGARSHNNDLRTISHFLEEGYRNHDDYLSDFADYIRDKRAEGYSDALGCSGCGNVYSSRPMLEEHFRTDHDLHLQAGDCDWTVWPSQDDYNEEPEPDPDDESWRDR